MAAIKLIQFQDATDFLSYLRPSRDHWWSNQPVIDYVFRGHSDENYKLLPTALRPPDGSLYSRIVDQVRNEEPSLGAYSLAVKSIERIMEFVAQVADDVGIEVGDGTPYITFPMSNLSYMALLQHYGAPTLFLDWTRSPLVAATFASKEETESAICVWAISKRKFALPNEVAGIDHRVKVDVFYGAEKKHNPFLRAQAGAFSYVHSTELRDANEQVLMMPLEELHDFCDEPALVKMVLPRSQVPKLRELIYRENLSTAHLMPDLKNVIEVGMQRCLSPWAQEPPFLIEF